MSIDFDEIADYYDAMYVDRDGYEKECEQVRRLLRKHLRSAGNSLLDIACGTGEQAKYLTQHFEVSGIDFSAEMIQIAKQKVPQADFFVADMFDFHLGRRFDAVVNLYGSIGFAENEAQLSAGIEAAWHHLLPGGVFILTPWSTRESFQEGIVSTAKNTPAICFCRMEVIKRLAENKVLVEMHHLIGRNLAVKQRKHAQTITLFREAEYRTALEKAGFEIFERLDPAEFRMGAFVCGKPLT